MPKRPQRKKSIRIIAFLLGGAIATSCCYGDEVACGAAPGCKACLEAGSACATRCQSERDVGLSKANATFGALSNERCKALSAAWAKAETCTNQCYADQERCTTGWLFTNGRRWIKHQAPVAPHLNPSSDCSEYLPQSQLDVQRPGQQQPDPHAQ